ncbi:hypothetical protein [Streptomyces sp. NPDC054940]
MNRTTNRTNSRKKAALAAGLSAAALLGAFATTQAADAAGAAEKTAHATATPRVFNYPGEEHTPNPAVRRPARLTLSEFTGIEKVHWKKWGAEKAVGTAKVTGMWCLDTCLDKPLDGVVTLSDPKTVHGKRVYSKFTLKLSGKPGKYDAEDLKGKQALFTG